MLLTDSPGNSPTKNEWTTEKEQELIKEMMEVGNQVGEKYTLGVISPETPNAYFNLLCFLIAYKTGTSLRDIQNFSLFDFISYLYIISRVSEEQGTTSPNIPEQREMEQMGI